MATAPRATFWVASLSASIGRAMPRDKQAGEDQQGGEDQGDAERDLAAVLVDAEEQAARASRDSISAPITRPPARIGRT